MTSMAGLRIVADENIPYAREAYGTLGDVRLLHGRRIAGGDLASADALFVRSITRVDARLLEGTPVRFVATATAGVDHVCEPDLQRLGIAFYAALGCNANAVAEYMAAAWLTVARRTGTTLSGRRVGVVGVGHVGSLVVEKARALGMTPVLNDPPKARETGRTDFRPLDELLECDILTCHTPLTDDGPDATLGLIGEPVLSRLKRGAWLCNAGRGGVVDEPALARARDGRRLGAVVLDVWEGEPAVDTGLVARVDLATAHIAGYSLEGKLNGTAMTYEAACRFFGVAPSWDAAAAAPPPDVPRIDVDASRRDDEDVLHEVVTAVYPILRDDAALRRAAAAGQSSVGPAFDELRKTYPTRREFRHTAVHIRAASAPLVDALTALQFRVVTR
jgi:erythronate-4-phosphate dehydrogenase